MKRLTPTTWWQIDTLQAVLKARSNEARRAKPVVGLSVLLALAACQGGSSDATVTDSATTPPPSQSGVQAPQGPSSIDAGHAEGDAHDAGDGADAADSEDASSVQAAPASLFLRLPDPLAALPQGDAQRSRVCERASDDPVHDVFCGEKPPSIGGLAELLDQLGLKSSYSVQGGIAMSGHSSGVSRRSVSAINPRVVFIQTESPDVDLLAATFTRGETFVEVVTRDRKSHELTFYAVAYTLPCMERPDGCWPGELLTETTEQDWQQVDLYQEEDLVNTTVDCRTCHQPDGPGTPKILRMQELVRPWTHWLYSLSRGGRALLTDFFAAHGDETFATIPSTSIEDAHPGLMAAFVRGGGSPEQPNAFPSGDVETEVTNSAPGQPADNSVAGQSQVWQQLYETAQRAEAIPVPYHDVKVTDPDKLAAMSQAYSAYLAGQLPLRALPDIRDVFPEDAVQRAEIGVLVDDRVADELLPKAACGLCHNRRLDQSLPRARFHLDLAQLSRDAKDTAIERLRLPPDDPRAMPPRRFYEMSDAVRDRMITLLQQ